MICNKNIIEDIYNKIIDDIPHLDEYDIAIRFDLRKIILIDKTSNKSEIKDIDINSLYNQIINQKLMTNNDVGSDTYINQGSLQADRYNKYWKVPSGKRICPSFVKFFMIIYFRTGHIPSELEYGILYNKIYVEKNNDNNSLYEVKDELQEKKYGISIPNTIKYNGNIIENCLCKFKEDLFNPEDMVINQFYLGEIILKLHKFYPSIIRMLGSMTTFSKNNHVIYYDTHNDYLGNDYIIDWKIIIKDSINTIGTYKTDLNKDKYSTLNVDIIDFETYEIKTIIAEKSIRLKAAYPSIEYFINYLSEDKYKLLKNDIFNNSKTGDIIIIPKERDD